MFISRDLRMLAAQGRDARAAHSGALRMAWDRANGRQPPSSVFEASGADRIGFAL